MEKVRTNQRAQHCENCGTLCQPGEGELYFLPSAEDNDDFDRVGTDRAHAHWEVICLDRAACAARVEAKKTEQRRIASVRKEAAAKEAAEKKAISEQQKAEFATLTAGLVRTDVRPEGATWVEEYAATGSDCRAQKLLLPTGETGWVVSWIGDMDGCYWLLPAAAKESAEAEKARLHRIYQWWRPIGYSARSYPGPGVPEGELTESERGEVAARTAAKWAELEEMQRRSIDTTLRPRPADRLQGCEAWRMLAAVGAEIEIVYSDEALAKFVRDYEATRDDRKAHDALRLEVLLRAKLPAAARNKNGSIKAAVERKLPSYQHDTSNRFIKVNWDVE